MGTKRHDDLIRDQFTKQADPFAQKMAAPDRLRFPVLRDLTRVTADDIILDVGLRPGPRRLRLRRGRAARHRPRPDPRHARPRRRLQAERGLTNVTWELGDIYHLPYADGAFPLVVTRYSFHHLTDPAAALQEMARVCAPGGRVCVIDMVVSRACAEAFNTVERYRDPSHTRALPPGGPGGPVPRGRPDRGRDRDLPDRVGSGGATAASAPEPGAADQFRAALRADVGRDALGLQAHLAGDELRYAYTNLAVVGWKGGAD